MMGDFLTNQINEIISPETELEVAICREGSFKHGIYWGKPRNGHPEGRILYHVQEVLNNVTFYSMHCTPDVRRDLRLIAIVHDTFKYKVNMKLPRTGDNHHATIAARYFESIAKPYLKPDHIKKLSTIIAEHDTVVGAYRKGERKSNMYMTDILLDRLMVTLFHAQAIPLFTLFYACDAHTVGKDQKDFIYFNEYVKRRSENEKAG